MKHYHEMINDFVKESKDLMQVLDVFKNQIKIILPIKEQEL